MAEPRPDIHELFCHYNSLYFRDALGACIVSWAPCLTSIEASCDCLEEGLCEIQLSVPLLKDRSSSDLKNILLHEMIHAFLWIKHKNSNHSDHGSEFLNIANSINSNLKNDYQRPSNGYNIVPRHGFQNEVNTCSVNLQKCASSGDLIEGRMDEEPSFSDCIEKNGCDTYCGNLLCEFDKHKRPFPDRLEVVDDAAGYKDKDKDKGKSIGVQGNERKKQRDSSHFSREARPEQLPAEEIKDKRVIKRPRIMADYLLSGDDKPKNLPKKTSQPDYSNCTELHITDLRTRSVAMGPDIPRQPRTTCKKVYNLCNNTEEIKYTERVREISFVIQRFDVYRDIESEEELQPLVNKRSESRKKMKLFNNSDGHDEQTITPTSHEVISLD